MAASSGFSMHVSMTPCTQVHDVETNIPATRLNLNDVMPMIRRFALADPTPPLQFESTPLLTTLEAPTRIRRILLEVGIRRKYHLSQFP